MMIYLIIFYLSLSFITQQYAFSSIAWLCCKWCSHLVNNCFLFGFFQVHVLAKIDEWLGGFFFLVFKKKKKKFEVCFCLLLFLFWLFLCVFTSWSSFLSSLFLPQNWGRKQKHRAEATIMNWAPRKSHHQQQIYIHCFCTLTHISHPYICSILYWYRDLHDLSLQGNRTHAHIRTHTQYTAGTTRDLLWRCFVCLFVCLVCSEALRMNWFFFRSFVAHYTFRVSADSPVRWCVWWDEWGSFYVLF